MNFWLDAGPKRSDWDEQCGTDFAPVSRVLWVNVRTRVVHISASTHRKQFRASFSSVVMYVEKMSLSRITLVLENHTGNSQNRRNERRRPDSAEVVKRLPRGSETSSHSR